MKFAKKYIQRIIIEEINKLFEEQEHEREILKIFVDMHNALIDAEKDSGKKLKVVRNKPSFNDILSNTKRDMGVDSNDLLDLLNNFKDKIDLDMYKRLSDAFTNDIYEIDAEYLENPESDEDFDAKMSDMYQKTTGKPDLRVVK